MAWVEGHLLSAVLFLPLIWGGIGLLFPSRTQRSLTIYKVWALLGSCVTFGLSLSLCRRFDSYGPDFQFVEQFSWVESLGISYFLGIDGISLWLALLTTFLSPLVILASFSAINQRGKEFYFLLLALETGMLGAFFSLDIFLFYVFWETMLVPMVFLIGIWGGKDRVYAAMKFVLYTVVGSLLMLVAIFYLSHQHLIQFGELSTSLPDLMRVQIDSDGWFSPQSLLFLAFALAFAIKVPMFPFHTWLPDAHVEAPTAGSVILAGVLLKMGGYGFVRFSLPLFPEATKLFQVIFLCLGATAVVYGAWVAMVQPDVKKLVAYSSVSHMGFVILGLFSLDRIGVMGSMYQMLSHGISTGALFLLVGILYERRHTREISAFGGVAKTMPLFACIFFIVTLSSIALPGTNGFVGEFLILVGAWKVSLWATAVTATGVVFSAAYMLWMFQRVMFGKIKNSENEKLKDLSWRETATLMPLILAIIMMGLVPGPFLNQMEPAVERLLVKVNGGQIAIPSETARWTEDL